MSNFTEKQPDSLFGIEKGIICQQVNCQGVMGAGLAKAIMEEYPVVYQSYRNSFQKFTKEELFGKFNVIHLTKNLSVANCYTQFAYGNPQKTGRVYTDAEKLVGVVDKICKKYPDLPVYLPHTKGLEGKAEYGIGCGYGGETWEHLAPRFASLGHPNLYLLDTKTGRVHTFENQPFKNPLFSSFPHVEQKYPFCNGMSKTGQKMEQFQADIAAAYSYKPLPNDVKKEALAFYLEQLPSSFQGEKREVKGGYEIQGKEQPLYLRNGEHVANGYSRIVVGNYGAFLEIESKDIFHNLLYTKPGEAYRETEKYKDTVKYFWKTVGNTGAKIYEQCRGTSYADYKPGCYYISPYEVLNKEECLERGLSWKEEFLPFPKKAAPLKEEKTQRTIDCDPSLYEGRPVIFDFETTGLYLKTDEPLQLSIVNEEGKVVFESLFKPYHKKTWADAEKVHHISPKMVAKKPHLDEYSDALRDIFEKASQVVGHNVSFDLRFLEEHAGISVNPEKVFDTYKEFRKQRPGGKHTLTDAVSYYCPEKVKQFELNAHNALYDTIATAAVYRKMKEREREELELE